MNGRPSVAPIPSASKGGSLARTIAGTGSWRYRTKRRSKPLFWSAVGVSAVFHAVVFFGFGHRAQPPKPVATDEGMTLTLVMPDLKDLEEPDRTPSDDETPVEAGLSVPTLADVPTQIDLTEAFVQQIDYSTLVPQQDLSAAKTLTIPVHIGRGTKLGDGNEKIFNLADLDRPPEPLVKIAPVVPLSLRQAGNRAVVAVGFIVDPSGQVRNAYVVRSEDHRYDDCALIGISKWKFRPGIKNGRRVNVRMMQPMIIEVAEKD